MDCSSLVLTVLFTLMLAAFFLFATRSLSPHATYSPSHRFYSRANRSFPHNDLSLFLHCFLRTNGCVVPRTNHTLILRTDGGAAFSLTVSPDVFVSLEELVDSC